MSTSTLFDSPPCSAASVASLSRANCRWLLVGATIDRLLQCKNAVLLDRNWLVDEDPARSRGPGVSRTKCESVIVVLVCCCTTMTALVGNRKDSGDSTGPSHQPRHFGQQSGQESRTEDVAILDPQDFKGSVGGERAALSHCFEIVARGPGTWIRSTWEKMEPTRDNTTIGLATGPGHGNEIPKQYMAGSTSDGSRNWRFSSGIRCPFSAIPELSFGSDLLTKISTLAATEP